MTDLVVGGGSVGTLIAWALATSGRDVAIVRRRHEGLPRSAELTVTDPDGQATTARVAELARPADLGAEPDVIVFAVKMFDLVAAVESCEVWPEAIGLTVGNGVGAEEIVASARIGPLIAGSVTASVEPTDERAVTRLNRGGVALAPVRGDVEAALAALVAAFRAAGLRARRVGDARTMKWSKLVANLVGNASSAILDASPADVYADAAAFDLERRQLLEALAVMRALGLRPVALPGADVRLLATGIRLPRALARPVLRRIVSGARGGKEPSLRLHVRTDEGPSEAAWLNGAVARAATALGRRAPVNACLARIVDEVAADPERAAWFRGRPDRLVEACTASS